jgi:hypothetical protein
VEAEVSTDHADALGRLVEIRFRLRSLVSALPVCRGERQTQGSSIRGREVLRGEWQ